MTDHIPGPWSRDPKAPFVIRSEAAGCTIAYLGPICTEGNARLIEVAPELLEALESSPHMLHTLPEGEDCRCSRCEFVRLRDAVIAMARGEQP